MMKLETLVVGQLATNCHIAWDEESLDGCVVDPGSEARRILEVISEHKIRIRYIFLTHGHFDHILAAEQVRAATGADVYISEPDSICLVEPLRSLYTSIMREPFRACRKHRIILGGESFPLGETEVHFMMTPGHSEGSMCILMDNVIFTGDTLLEGTCGRVDLPGGDKDAMMASLRRLYALTYDYVIMPGHGPPSVLSIEKENNQMMKASI